MNSKTTVIRGGTVVTNESVSEAAVLIRGEVIVDGEEFLGTPGRGRFLPCKLD